MGGRYLREYYSSNRPDAYTRTSIDPMKLYHTKLLIPNAYEVLDMATEHASSLIDIKGELLAFTDKVTEELGIHNAVSGGSKLNDSLVPLS